MPFASFFAHAQTGQPMGRARAQFVVRAARACTSANELLALAQRLGTRLQQQFDLLGHGLIELRGSPTSCRSRASSATAALRVSASAGNVVRDAFRSPQSHKENRCGRRQAHFGQRERAVVTPIAMSQQAMSRRAA